MKKTTFLTSGILFLLLISAIPLMAQEPWDTPQGQQCIEQWIREAMSRINSFNGNSDFNARKPWRINQWGLLNGNPRYGPTSAYAPDNFSQYKNKYHYMWHYWHASNGIWRWDEWNSAGVPHIRTFVLHCNKGKGGGGGGGVGPPPGPIGSVTASGAAQTSSDFVQKSERLAGDGVGDWAYPIRLNGSGTVVSISINNISGQRSIWDTIPNNGLWLTAVYGGGKILNKSDGSVYFRINGSTELTLYAADNGSLASGNSRYRITIKFQDGKITTLDPAVSRTAQVGSSSRSVGGGVISGHRPPLQSTKADTVGPNENLRGDGKFDWVFPISLSGMQGVITGITVRNSGGTHSVWDTYPRNGFWQLGVTTNSGRILNNTDGSVAINAAGLTGLNLYVCDAGSLKSGKTNFKVTIKFKDGSTIERSINRW